MAKQKLPLEQKPASSCYDKRFTPIERKFYSILHMQSLIGAVIYYGFEYEYNIADKDDRQFLDSIKDISHDVSKLKEKAESLAKEYPDIDKALARHKPVLRLS